MKPRFYDMLMRAIDEGSARGVNRSYKYTDNPDRDTIIDNVYNEVVSSIHEYFEFPDPQETRDGTSRRFIKSLDDPFDDDLPF